MCCRPLNHFTIHRLPPYYLSSKFSLSVSF
jgi:hypothetical protein